MIFSNCDYFISANTVWPTVHFSRSSINPKIGTVHYAGFRYLITGFTDQVCFPIARSTHVKLLRLIRSNERCYNRTKELVHVHCARYTCTIFVYMYDVLFSKSWYYLLDLNVGKYVNHPHVSLHGGEGVLPTCLIH